MNRPPDVRSNGGYSLRIKGGKKHLSEDFEYYFSKIGDSQYGSKGHESSPSEYNNQRSHTHKRPSSRGHCVDTSQEVLAHTDSAYEVGSKRVVYVDQSEILEQGVQEDITENLLVDHHSDQAEVLQFLVSPNSTSSHLKVSHGYQGKSDELNIMVYNELEELVEEEEDEELESVQMDFCTNPLPPDGSIDKIEDVVFTGKNGKKRRAQHSDFSSGDVVRFRQLKSTDRVECLECHKLLKPNSYRQHIRTHTGEKPFSCTVCGAHFTRRGDVDRHVSIVHKKQKPFQCQQCNRSFGDRKNLRWHLANHDKKLFYVCPVCGFKFGKREYFENHVQFLHPTEAGSDEEAILQQVDQEQFNAEQMELEGLKIVSFKNTSSPHLLKLPVDHSISLNDVSAPRSPQSVDPGNTTTVVIQFDKDGNGHLSEWDPPSSDLATTDLVGSPVTCIASDEYIFDIAQDSGFAETSNWTHTLDRLSNNLKKSSHQTVRDNASQVIELVMDAGEEVTYDSVKLETSFIPDCVDIETKAIEQLKPDHVKEGNDEQAVQVWGGANELEESHFILEENALILGQEPNSVVQFVTDDGCVVTGSDQLLSSNILDIKQNVVLKICGLQESSMHTDVTNCDFTSSGNYNNTLKTLLLSTTDPVVSEPIN